MRPSAPMLAAATAATTTAVSTRLADNARLPSGSIVLHCPYTGPLAIDGAAMSMTFSQWLSHSAAAEFESFVRTRRDLLQPESPTIGALAAAASSRIGVSRGIEALDADELEVLISLATAARTGTGIAVGENPHTDPTRAEAALPRRLEPGLAWPTSGTGPSGASDSASVLAAHPVWRIQSEAITLLPTSAAESARARPWQIDPVTVDASTATIAQPLIHNSEQ